MTKTEMDCNFFYRIVWQCVAKKKKRARQWIEEEEPRERVVLLARWIPSTWATIGGLGFDLLDLLMYYSTEKGVDALDGRVVEEGHRKEGRPQRWAIALAL